MTINEFKAFLEGMDIHGCPTEYEWKRIKEKIDELEAFKTPSDSPGFTWEPNTCITIDGNGGI